MDKIKKIKINILIYIAVSLVTIIALIYLVIIPQELKINNIKIGINNQLVALEKTYKQGQSLKKITANLKTIESKLEELEKIYIKKDEAYLFAALLEDIASQNNISQKINLAPYSKDPLSKYSQGSLEETLTGTYPNLLNYLSDLESQEHYINIQSMEISNTAVSIGSESDNGKNITMKIKANIYWSEK